MSKIILVDPQDKAERFWWIGIVVDKDDYKLFYSEMGGDFADLDENLKNNVQKHSVPQNALNQSTLEPCAEHESMLVCYFEDGSFSFVNKNEIMELKMDEPPFTEWIKDKSFKNSRAVKNLYKFLDDKIPAKFKWLKKKRKMNGDGVFKKKMLQRKADQSFGEHKSNENGN